MEKQYNPSAIEDSLYAEWLAQKQFHADEHSKKKSYSIVIPPPNVTGILHMGHALNNTIQDALIRYKHMNGFATLWMPGTDHAGIATQNVVERKLAKEKKDRHQLGREKFVEEVWKWKHEHQSTIISQLKRLGTSCDWERERFTMDDGLSHAVKTVFVRLFKDGLIYRGKYIINWCPRCQTALSDEEAEHKETGGKLYYFKYPFKDGTGHLVVATTRPETMLGDTAVAVNPKDGRYATFIGKTLILPLVGREIPVIADDFVDKEFGTGAVKVTPAHDPNDYQMGMRHNLAFISVMDEAAKMTGPIPEKYRGLDRFACRQAVLVDMEDAGLVGQVTDHTHAVGHCYRCATMVEPYYSDQWFVKMKPLAEPSLAAAQKDEVRFFPARWRKTYIDWMENIRDWCISRQIWWGHQIPAWYVVSKTNGKRTKDTPIIVAMSEAEALSLALAQFGDGAKLEQESDVLDTWFSSWLWPFSTMGWPEETALLAKYYPTSTLVTAPEILFFWVARMIMAGMYCTGKLPFTDVVLHGTVRDKSGRKMSKSLGNAIDPLEIISVNGADALRFSMLMITAQGADVFLSKDTFDIGRNFCNKLWNASRFLLGNIENPLVFSPMRPADLARFTDVDTWILSGLNATIRQVREAIDSYRFNEACHALYDFTWHDFCDWYVEAIKSDLYGDGAPARKNDALWICSTVLANILKMLHPVMPFITEEIWKNLALKINYPDVIDTPQMFNAQFPKEDPSFENSDIDARFTLLKEVITALRTIRAENNVPPDRKGRAIIIPDSSDASAWLKSQHKLIALFAKLESCVVDTAAAKPQFAGQAVARGCALFLELEGLIDKQVEIDRLAKEMERTQKLVELSAAKLASPSFAQKAPPAVVAKEKEKHDGLVANLDKLKKNLEAMR
jgi:valyl-tRNA synthetase